MDNKINNEVKKQKEVKKNLFSNKRILKILYLVVILIYVLINNIFIKGSDFVLGDFGSIIPLLLYFFTYMSFKWLPVFCIAGILFLFFEDKFKEMSKSFLWIVTIVVIVATVLKFVV